MSKSFTHYGALAGVLGSILTLGAMLIGIFFPDNGLPSAPIFGVCALLLLAGTVSLLLVHKGRPELLSTISLVAAITGLIAIVLYAILEALSGSTEGYWNMLMFALLLMILGISIYAVTAVIARIVPAWVGVPLAAVGVALLLLVLIFLTGFVNLPTATRDSLGTVAGVLLVAFIALWGIMSLTITRSRGAWDASPASRGVSPSSDVTA